MCTTLALQGVKLFYFLDIHVDAYFTLLQHKEGDHQYLVRAVWSSQTSRDLTMDDPAMHYINRLVEQSLLSIDELEHEQVRL